MISLDEAWKAIGESVSPAGRTATVLLDAAEGLCLSRGLAAISPSPGFDTAAVHGFAIFDALDARADGILSIEGSVQAGDPPPPPSRRGTALHVEAGAALPENCYAVAPTDAVEESGGFVSLCDEVPAGAFVRRRGAEVKPNDWLIPPGRRVGLAEIALFASQGISHTEVHEAPRCAVLTFSRRFAPKGAACLHGQTYDAVTPMVSRIAVSCGCRLVESLSIRADEEIPPALEVASTMADVVLVLGVRPEMLEAAVLAAGRLVFDSVAVRPGRDTFLGSIGRSWILGVPGEPFSAFCAFQALGRALLRRLGGETLEEEWILASVTGRHGACGVERILPARLERVDGQLRATPLASGDAEIRALADLNCLALLPALEDHESGDSRRILLPASSLPPPRK
jgi:molybdopterin molybdotransferase